MSKSIYEEALEILRDSLQYPQDEHDEYYILNFEQINKTAKTILQAQKQEKLLELYRELITIKDELISLAFNDASWYDTEEIEIETNLEKQIKELENDK